MPTDYGDDTSMETYIDICAKITALYEDCAAISVLIGGDFNCPAGSRFTIFLTVLLVTIVLLLLMFIDYRMNSLTVVK